ncbi:hypothetical protein F1559_004009 [Cyanidiococcus yangmingshanensis]|uniref:NnrU domain-containing protein n=1 Tax=Cyanidiococcus yangmingshanensis TaxID=2690220 RepID=A0A7J7IMI4_9RHOD|nr:hypothetical protein F1559_004009 [Cyanidiococcus yangmingshanensis]
MILFLLQGWQRGAPSVHGSDPESDRRRWTRRQYDGAGSTAFGCRVIMSSRGLFIHQRPKSVLKFIDLMSTRTCRAPKYGQMTFETGTASWCPSRPRNRLASVRPIQPGLYRHVMQNLRHSSLVASSVPKQITDTAPKGHHESQAALWLGSTIYLIGWVLPAYWSCHDHLDPQTHFTMLGYYTAFAVLHSGGAAIRVSVARLIGERLYRIIFALVSLPLAGVTVAYFLVHRRDGMAFVWLQEQLPSLVPHFHEVIWLMSAISFLFLYPATLDLAQVAAIARPTVRLYENGIIRITRHPQLWGQVLWCLAHCAWIGSSMSITISCALIGHHFVAAWHGDRRLEHRFGTLTWQAFADRASLWPFWSIVQGKQSLREALREMYRPAYLGVLVFVYAAYSAHPLFLQWASETALFR